MDFIYDAPAVQPDFEVLLLIMENDVSPPLIGFLRAPVIKVTSTMYVTLWQVVPNLLLPDLYKSGVRLFHMQ